MKAFLKYHLVVLFLLVLISPFLNNLFGWVQLERRDENRTFTDSLNIDINRLDYFPKDTEAYINDNFSFREPLLRIFSRIKYYGLSVSPKPEQTILGKDGYMFMAGEEVEQVTGRQDFTTEQLDSFKQLWQERNNYFSAKEIKTYLLICPTKHSVYTDRLPFFIVPSKKPSRIKQIKNALSAELPDFVIDPTDALKQKMAHKSLYFKMDNHWNFRAGKLVSDLLIERISKDFASLSYDLNVQWADTVLKQGIHYSSIGIDELSEISQVPKIINASAQSAEKFGFQWPENFAYFWEYEHHFKSQNKNGLRILVIRDSFGQHIIPFLSEAFEESLFIFDAWEYGLNEEILERYQPDIVIYMTVENLLENQIRSKP